MTSSSATSILIVEDERIVAMDLQQTLAELGYDAFAVASTAEEALAAATRRCPDLVLMDIRIKGERDGIETAACLREQFRVPVVYLTAHADDATVDRAKKTEPQGYLLKPVKAAELRSAIEVSLFRHEMEKQLKERERWFSTTLRSIADAVVTVDLSGIVTFMNPAAEALTGMKAADCLGRPARDVLKLSDVSSAAPLETPLERALRQEQPIELPEANVHGAGGVKRIVSDSAARVVSENDEVLGAVMVFRDVTERKILERQLELADRLSSLGTMAAGVAHEINNPLAVVVANVEFVGEALQRAYGVLTAGQATSDAIAAIAESIDMQQEIRVAVERIRRIVGDLKAFSRPAESPSEDADVLRAIRWAVRATANELRHRATVTVDAEDLPKADIDEIRLGQVLVNLLVNAAHAIQPGKATENAVTVRARAVGEAGVEIEVKDTGEGMSKDVLARMFEPFFTTKPVGSGTGLGLSICHGIVRSAGGEIHAESEPGKGTVIRVGLRVARRGSRPPSWVPPAETKRGRILVIDDEMMVLKMLRRVLARHELVCVQSAEEAVTLLQKGETFDLLLSDLTMPTMTGMAFYEWVLGFDPEIARRVVFMSGGAVTDKLHDFMRTVPNACVEKPFDIARLQALVQKLLVRMSRTKPS